jgi:DNA repair protein RadC
VLPARVTLTRSNPVERVDGRKRVTVKEDNSSVAETLALLDRLRTELTEICSQAKTAEQWVWVEFEIPPLPVTIPRLKQLGFHWNVARRCWQHSCGARGNRIRSDPKARYEVGASAIQMSERALMPKELTAKEFKIIALKRFPLPEAMHLCDTPEKAVDYWHRYIAADNPYFNPEVECFAVLILNTRRRVKGHQLISFGTMDTILVHPRDVFRGAVIAAAAAAIVLMHNHPSGQPEPSEADIKVTRDLIRAGQLLKIEVLDHVIVGADRFCSLRNLGYIAGF